MMQGPKLISSVGCGDEVTNVLQALETLLDPGVVVDLGELCKALRRGDRRRNRKPMGRRHVSL